MKRMLAVIFAAFAFVCIAGAQDVWNVVPDASGIVSAFNDANSRVVSIDCSFTEEKYVDVLDAKSVSTGHFSFAAPDRILIEYLSPEKSSVSIDGDKMKIVSEGKESDVNLASSRQYRRMFSMFSGNSTGKGRLPEAKAFERPGQYMLVFEMRQGGLSGTVEAVLRASDMSLESFRMKNGEDYTEFRFTDKVICTE